MGLGRVRLPVISGFQWLQKRQPDRLRALNNRI